MKRFFAMCAAAVLVASAVAQDNKSADQRVDDLIAKMTLHEKAGQIAHHSPAITRLGVPAYDWWSEGLHGVARAGYATVFPQAIGLAATWDTKLMHDVGDTISTEFRAKYAETVKQDGSSEQYRGLTVWSPNINIFRDPRWGRGQETYGEDPYLTSRMGLAFIRGLQGNDQHNWKTIATSKHFAVHSGPESTRHTVDVKASTHDMEDTYLPAFRATVTEGDVQSIMCAYNSLNGEPACANGDLLQDHLRSAWGFKGYVVSDCGAISDIYDGHKFSKTPEEAVAAAINRGTDLFCTWDWAHLDQAVEKAVQKGLLPETQSDQALRRIFRARAELGILQAKSPSPWAKITTEENDTAAHHALALKTAQESLVLLKNDGLLPLKEHLGTIAVIGPNAENIDVLVGNYNGTPSAPVTLLAGLTNRFRSSHIEYAGGAPVAGHGPDWAVEQAVRAAQSADLVVLALGLTPQVEGEEMQVDFEGFAGGDRTSIDLPRSQEQLLEKVGTLGKPIVVVLLNGSALAVNWADQHANAILEAWYPGEEGGTAIAGALAGDFSPAGRLPVTFYSSLSQLPAFDDYSMSQRTYRYFPGKPLYDFGFGLSYTNFSYSNLRVSPKDMPANGTLTVSVDVKNAGSVESDEVVQLYTSHKGVAGAPLKALAAFERVHLRPAETKTVEFRLTNRALSIVDPTGKRIVPQGEIELWLGGGQPRTHAAGIAGRANITSALELPR